MLGILSGSKYTKAFYLESLKMLNDIFAYARKNGLAKLEGDVDDPHKSQLFSNFPKFVKDHHAVDFVCDTLRMFISSGTDAFELDQMMELDMEVHHHESGLPIAALSSTADALPGLGIVAAVLGIVITMGALGGPPEEIGHKVGASLVGTFLGILLCYGFLGPIAANLTKVNEAEGQYYHFLRVGVISFAKGRRPSLRLSLLAVPFHRAFVLPSRKWKVRAGVAEALQQRHKPWQTKQNAPSSSSRKKAAMGDIMAEPGRWPTLTSSRP